MQIGELFRPPAAEFCTLHFALPLCYPPTTMHPTNLEIILDDAKLIESRACRDALLEATSLYTGPSKSALLAALDEFPWQPHFFDLLRAAILNHEPVGKIALQAFAGPAFLPAFLEIGSALLALSSDIRAVRPLAAKEGLFENDRNWRYIKEYPSMLFYVFGSMWLGRCLGLPSYDPRRTLENNGGSLYDEFFGTKRIRTLYTPTPTIGNSIAPEFLACLEELRDNPQFDAFSYVNLQSITSKSEGARVRAIMQLNEQFPNLFFGITLPQNSRFFEDHNASALDLKEQLLHPANFTLENRIGSNDPGYYFPGNRARWQEVLLSIFDRAYAITQDKCALTELVHLGIIRYHQMYCLKNKRSLLSTVACKESIDRGGKINAELFWATAPESPDKETIFFSMFQARALLTRRRFIVPERLQEIEALLAHVPQSEAMRFLHDICSEFQVDSAKIKFL